MENLNMAKQNKVAVNLVQDFTDAEKAQARQNIGASQINYDSTVTDMTITKEIVRPYMNTKYTATVGNDNFLLLPSTFSDGMVVKSNGSLQTQSIPSGVPAGGSDGQVLTWNNNSYDWASPASALPIVTRYTASWGSSWASMRQLDDDITSGNTLRTVTLSTPIPLSANKRYLIIPEGITGSVEQTKTLAHTVNNSYRLAMWLYDSNQNRFIGTTAVILASAEITNHHTAALGDYPPVGGKYQASFNSCASIIEPEVDLSLDTLSIINTGNISWGFNSSNPALLVFDNRIDAINVMEIQ